jgi:hypothetical protein
MDGTGTSHAAKIQNGTHKYVAGGTRHFMSLDITFHSLHIKKSKLNPVLGVRNGVRLGHNAVTPGN